ncbi:MAG: primosomal protein N' [Planctomycetes bacterium]|nr:primosomal protein N' [Planctomycetota bacterium]
MPADMVEQEVFVEVAIPRPLDRLFHYRVPRPLAGAIAPGQRVRVPFGRGNAVGVCVGFVRREELFGGAPIRDLIAPADPEPIFGPELLGFTRWLATYYAAPWGEVLAGAMPPAIRSGKTARPRRVLAPLRPPEELARAAGERARRAPAQARILAEIAACDGPVPLADALARAGTDASAAERLQATGLVEIRVEPWTPAGRIDGPEPPELSAEQDRAVGAISRAVDEDRFEAFLLHGVTGSGKTEVYLRALARAVEKGRQGIVLIPEIALTPQTVRRFRERFHRVAVQHSMLSDGDRAAQWLAIREGRIDVVVGARSAVFSPVPRLGLIVVDEEHESTYKQESSPRYNGRDAAVKRAQLAGVPIVLGSATPTVESYANARQGKYARLVLPRRVTPHDLPGVVVVPIEPSRRKHGWLTEDLEALIADRLRRREQVILFLNRRGFATTVLCPRCGYAMTCENCAISLTFHRSSGAAVCHYCGLRREPPSRCPGCAFEGIRFVGVGTERIAEAVAARFPTARVERLDSDAARSRAELERILAAFGAGEIDIIVGTQMIAKGHDFPRVTLVGIVMADTGLHFPDFRSAERTFHQITQVAGRAGRGERRGRVIVQTFSPEHYAIRCAAEGDMDGFYNREIEGRKALGYPPFGKLMKVLVQSAREEAAREEAARLAGILARPPAPYRVLGPAPSPIARIQRRYRFQLLVKAAGMREMTIARERMRKEADRRGSASVAIDIDPVALL